MGFLQPAPPSLLLQMNQHGEGVCGGVDGGGGGGCGDAVPATAAAAVADDDDDDADDDDYDDDDDDVDGKEEDGVCWAFLSSSNLLTRMASLRGDPGDKIARFIVRRRGTWLSG